MAYLGAWPIDICPRTCLFLPVTNQVVNRSPFGGSQQVIDRLNDLWTCSLTLPVRSHARAAEIEAFLASFRGQVNWIDLWHFLRPVPRGTLRDTLQVAPGGAAAGADSLSLQAFRSLVNRLLNTEAIDLWTGKTFITVVPDAHAGPFNTGNAEKLIPTTVNTQHSLGTVVQGGVPAGVPFNLSAYMRQGELRYGSLSRFDGTFPYYMGALFDLQDGVIVDTINSRGTAAIEPAPNGYWRCSVAAAAINTNDAQHAQVRPMELSTSPTGSYAGDDVKGIYAWGLQFTEGADLKPYQRVGATAEDYDTAGQLGGTLLGGDMLGAGGQLLMVGPGVHTVGVGGALIVPIVNRLRSALVEGAAVTWDKPSAPFRLLSHSGVMYVPGYAEEVSLQLEEKVGI